MSTIMKISSRNLSSLRRRSLVKGGMAGIFASGLAPSFARAEPKKLVMAHITPPPESGAVAFSWQAEEVRKRSGGEHHGERRGHRRRADHHAVTVSRLGAPRSIA